MILALMAAGMISALLGGDDGSVSSGALRGGILPGLQRSAYIAKSSGPCAYSGTSVTVPRQVYVANGNPITVQAQTISVPAPGALGGGAERDLATITSGTVAYPNNPVAFTRVAVIVTNTSGGSVSGTITTGGADEHYPYASPPSASSEVLTIPTVTNNGTVTVFSGKYYGAGSGYNASNSALLGAGAANNFTVSVSSGNLGNSGVTIRVAEYQYRLHLKLTPYSAVGYTKNILPAWDNDYVDHGSGEQELCQMEVQSSGIISMIDWRQVGPTAPAQRMGSQIVNWSSYTSHGPPSGSAPGKTWNDLCVYSVIPLMDGDVLISGNTGILDLWDGEGFETPYTMPAAMSGSASSGSSSTLTDSTQAWSVNQWAGWTVRITAGTGNGETALVVSNTATTLSVLSWPLASPNAGSTYNISPLDNNLDHLTAGCDMGFDLRGHEIVYFGTATGKLIQWDRTANIYSVFGIGAFSGGQIQRIFKGGSTTQMIAVGYSAQGVAISNNGAASPTTTSYSGQGWSSLTNDPQLGYCWFDHHHYFVGGFSGGFMRFFTMGQDALNPGVDLTKYLPGTQSELGRTSSASSTGIQDCCVTPDGRIILVGDSSAGGPYVCEWNCWQRYSTGQLAFTTSGTTTVPAGTIASGMNSAGDTVQYETLEPCTSVGAQTVYAYAVALTPGQAGMMQFNQITTMVSAVTGVVSVTNSSPFGYGRYIGPVAGQSSNQQFPSMLVSTNPRAVCASGKHVFIGTSGADVVVWDGSQYRTILTNPGKGVCNQIVYDANHNCVWVVDDEGHVWTIPA